MSELYPWPQGKRCAVAVTVLFDDGLDAIAVAPDLVRRVKSYSVWRYGAMRGVERLCRLFEDRAVRTSWFVPGELAAPHAERIADVARAGHEIACHGYGFSPHDAMGAEESLVLLRQARSALSAASGQAIRGFRLPSGNWPHGFDRVVREAGFGWSMSLNGDDVPYRHPSSLVEVPVHIELEDRPYFQFNFTPAFPKGLGRLPSYDGVLANWIAEFDAYRRYGGCFVLQIRPEWSGTPGRIGLIGDLLAHIGSFDDVWVATGSEIADWHRQLNQTMPAEHPLQVFEAYVREGGQ